FAEVEMGRDGVFEKMDDQIAKQNQERCIMSAEFEADGNNFHQRGRQHESCSQSDEIFQISSLPVPLHDDGAAENIGGGGREAEEDTCQDWIHRRGDNNISVLSSQFSVLSSRFSVLSSQFSVLSSQNYALDCNSLPGVQPSQMISLDLVRMSVEAGMGKSYRELVGWQKAMLLVTNIYRATKTFPIEERYGLTNQLRRAAVSVPSNIAEGQARFSSR